MNKYAILILHDRPTFVPYRYLFRYTRKSMEEQNFGHPKMIDPVCIASDNPSAEYCSDFMYGTPEIYFSSRDNEDILFEAETDEDAKLYFEVCDK